MFFNCHSSRFVCRPAPYVLPSVCLHQELVPLSNSVQPDRPAVASRSCFSRGPVCICVILTGSITTLKCNNIICNNKNKLTRWHLCTTCTYSSVSWKRATQTTRTLSNEPAPKTHVSTTSRYSLSPKHK